MIARTFGRKIALGGAVACAIGTAASLAAAMYFLSTRGAQDVLSASALATAIFFAGCTVVLYVMSQPPRHKLLPWDE